MKTYKITFAISIYDDKKLIGFFTCDDITLAIKCRASFAYNPAVRTKMDVYLK